MTLEALFTEYWEFVLKSLPTLATFVGDHRYDDKLDDLSQEAFDRWTRKAEDLLDRARRIPRESLRQRDMTNYDLFMRELQQRVDIARFRPNLMPISQLGGPHIDLPQLIAITRFESASDYENYNKRLLAFPAQIDQTISSLEEGLRTAIVLPKVIAEKVLSQVKLQIVSSPEASPLYEVAGRFPAGFTQTEREHLSSEMKRAIRDHVVPAYQKLLNFIQDRYLPECRTDVGLWALPDGKDRYAFYVYSFTTVDLSPEQVHELGKSELASIQSEMRLIMDKVGFEGDFRAFLEYLRSEPKFQNTSTESILSGYRDILDRFQQKVNLLFGRIPKQRFEMKEIEPFRAEAAPGAHYFPAPDDGSRPAYFYVNTYKPESRPKYEMEAIAYHEAVPGHHFQISLQQELKDLPSFRRHGGYVWPGYSAFVEGWGLYSEVLPKEVGFYQDPYSDFGRLMMDAFRSVRLVVDTGIHHFKWTREEAIKFFEANTSLSTQNIAAEVDRYMVFPGQALAYKIGQLKIRELRARAEKALGKKFDIRAFHDELLSDGSLPLDIAEKKMDAWVSRVSQ